MASRPSRCDEYHQHNCGSDQTELSIQLSSPSWIPHDVNLGNKLESNELRSPYISQNPSFPISQSVGKLDFLGFWLAEISSLSGRSPRFYILLVKVLVQLYILLVSCHYTMISATQKWVVSDVDIYPQGMII